MSYFPFHKSIFLTGEPTKTNLMLDLQKTAIRKRFETGLHGKLQLNG